MLSKDHWSLSTLNQSREFIDTSPDYQRPYVWGTSQKQLLIDTILRGYDIPKLYLRVIDDNNFEVIDGQQRIRTIWDFYDDKFAISQNAEPVNDKKIAGLRYSQLDFKTKLILDKYNLDFALVSNCSEDEIREMFLRLQNGTTLKAQEIRNAIPGKMRDFVKTVSSHEFFKKVVFEDKRFSHDHVAAQMCLLAINGGLCNVKDKDLNNMYYNNKDFNDQSSVAKKVTSTLNYLNMMYDGQSPVLKRYNVISLYALILDLSNNYVIKGREKEIGEWFTNFEHQRLLDKEKDETEQNPRLVAYHERISHSTDGLDSLTYRHNLLKEYLFVSVEHLPMKDQQRSFDEVQKQVIYLRDKGICQICKKHCEWNAWEADHITPWSKGGQTEIENGQVLCPECNKKKSDDAS